MARCGAKFSFFVRISMYAGIFIASLVAICALSISGTYVCAVIGTPGMKRKQSCC